MAIPILSDLDMGNVVRVRNLPSPLLSTDAVPRSYVDAAIEGLQDKGTCKVATQSNVNVAAPGATIDGITMAVNDRVLFRAQTTASENGIYIFNGSAVPATRSLDMNLSAEFNQAIVSVNQGTSAGGTFRQTAVDPTVGTTAIAFVSFGGSVSAATTGAAGIVRLATQTEANTGTDATIAITPATLAGFGGMVHRFAATFGDGSATQFTLSHNLNSLDWTARVYRVSDNVTVGCDSAASGVNGIVLNFATAPAVNQYRCVVHA